MRTLYLNANNVNFVCDQIRNLNPNKEWAIDVREKSAKRTLPQNSLYWKWVSILGNELGYHKEEMHEVLMAMFLTPKKIRDLSGNTIEKYSTSKLNTQEMTEYMEALARWAASEGLALPHPEDMHVQG
jgi:hypothetical protein